jgi:hypothetical protein
MGISRKSLNGAPVILTPRLMNALASFVVGAVGVLFVFIGLGLIYEAVHACFR